MVVGGWYQRPSAWPTTTNHQPPTTNHHPYVFAPYIDLTREEWSRLRNSTPLTLAEDDLAKLRGINEQVCAPRGRRHLSAAVALVESLR